MTRAYTFRYKLLAVATCALASTQAAAATTHVTTCQLDSTPTSTVKGRKKQPEPEGLGTPKPPAGFEVIQLAP